ncbi:MAG: hypothetical protein JSS02_30095 [Planctomycetes bacterium]|nr:hypothetical protein [Planctomycetota bacterium]
MKVLLTSLVGWTLALSLGNSVASAQEIAQPKANRSTAVMGGISPIYSYAGRVSGPLNAHAIQYYSYGGTNGWGNPYNSAYYESGYNQVNACCRAQRRLCTPFGGMAYGCKPGCYVGINPPCPTGYDSFGVGFIPPAAPEKTGGYAPEPMPATPGVESPAPGSQDVKPEPQAVNKTNSANSKSK